MIAFNVDTSHMAAQMFLQNAAAIVCRVSAEGQRLDLLEDLPASEALFRQLARVYPLELLRRLESGSLSPGLLARGAEAAGLMLDNDMVHLALLPLLHHESPIVREAAMYGLERHMDDDVASALRALLEDPTTTATVREVALEILEEYEG